MNYRLWEKLYLGFGFDWYYRNTRYDSYKYYDYEGIYFGSSCQYISSQQLSFQLKLTYKL